MWLLDKLLKKLVRNGELVVTDYDNREYRYGSSADRPIRIRLTDKGASFHIAKDPRVGAGEAYMDGRLEVEPPHDIRDLVLFITANGKGERSGQLRPRGPLRKFAVHAAAPTPTGQATPSASSDRAPTWFAR